MIVTDPRQPDNPIVFANQAFLAMTGYDESEILGTNCRFLQGPDTDRAVIAQIRDAIAAKHEIATEVLNYRKDGSTFWNALFISPIHDESGEVIYFFASQLDVSRRRDAEDALHQSQKMEALGQLTGGIAHDFNNLLQVMFGYVDLAKVGLESGMAHAKVVSSLDRVTGAIEKASTLTQQLLAFARKQSLSGRAVNLNQVVTAIAHLAAHTLGDQVSVTTNVAGEGVNVRVDPTQLEVALLNILVNARDALVDTSNAQVVLTTESMTLSEPRVIGFADLAPGRYGAISIHDNGVGIPAEIIDRVLDPFFTTKAVGKGTGLGLSMVYGFLKQSGGALNIVSEPGKGTTIVLFFPALDADDNAPPAPVKMVEQAGTERILVVDDRPEVADVSQALLEQMGYQAMVAYSPAAALEVLGRDSSIDMLLTDLIMPGKMNGVMLAREARRMNPDIRILLTTGFAESELTRPGDGASEFDILYKPFNRTELAKKVKIVLKGPTGVG